MIMCSGKETPVFWWFIRVNRLSPNVWVTVLLKNGPPISLDLLMTIKKFISDYVR